MNVLLLTSLYAKSLNQSLLSEGDIIFQESLSEQATAIKLATKSRYTHVGIIFKYGNTYKVLEAIEPVKITDLNLFIQRGKNKHFVIKRIKGNPHTRKNLSNEKLWKFLTWKTLRPLL